MISTSRDVSFTIYPRAANSVFAAYDPVEDAQKEWTTWSMDQLLRQRALSQEAVDSGYDVGGQAAEEVQFIDSVLRERGHTAQLKQSMEDICEGCGAIDTMVFTGDEGDVSGGYNKLDWTCSECGSHDYDQEFS